MNEPERNSRQNAEQAAPALAVEPAQAFGEGNALPVLEFYGPKGLEPTRYGDWERKGRCVDF